MLAALAGDLLTQSLVPTQRVPRLPPMGDPEDNSLQQLAAVCGHHAPLFDPSFITR